MHETFSESISLPRQQSNEVASMVIPRQATAPSESHSIVGLHGAWSSESYYDEFAEIVTNEGHAFYAPRYTIDNPNMNYSDQADEITDKILSAQDIDHDRIDLLAHSRAGNLAPLIAARIAVRSITYINAIIPGTHEDFESLVEIDEVYIKHPPAFLHGIVTANEVTFVLPDAGEHAFFNDCSLAQKATYKHSLRLNRQREEDVVLGARPNTPELAIVCDEDQTIKAGWQKARCLVVLGRKPDVTLPGTGHTPFLSRPKQFAEIQLGLLARV